MREDLASARMVLQIHDELVFEAPASKAERIAEFVKNRMQNAMQLKVPLVVDVAWSKNWIDAK
jgi:DNA polymerase-1